MDEVKLDENRCWYYIIQHVHYGTAEAAQNMSHFKHTRLKATTIQINLLINGMFFFQMMWIYIYGEDGPVIDSCANKHSIPK